MLADDLNAKHSPDISEELIGWEAEVGSFTTTNPSAFLRLGNLGSTGPSKSPPKADYPGRSCAGLHQERIAQYLRRPPPPSQIHTTLLPANQSHPIHHALSTPSPTITFSHSHPAFFPSILAPVLFSLPPLSHLFPPQCLSKEISALPTRFPPSSSFFLLSISLVSHNCYRSHQTKLERTLCTKEKMPNLA